MDHVNYDEQRPTKGETLEYMNEVRLSRGKNPLEHMEPPKVRLPHPEKR